MKNCGFLNMLLLVVLLISISCQQVELEGDLESLYLLQLYSGDADQLLVSSAGNVVAEGSFTGWTFTSQCGRYILRDKRGVLIFNANDVTQKKGGVEMLIANSLLSKDVDWDALTFHYFDGKILTRDLDDNWSELKPSGQLVKLGVRFFHADFYDFWNLSLIHISEPTRPY